MGHSRGRTRALIGALALVLMTSSACGNGTEPRAQDAATPTPADPTPAETAEELSGAVRLYTSVTEDTVEAVVSAYRDQHPDVEVEVFRAPTGELNARVAAEQREGQVQADVLWLTDPLSMQEYAAQDLLRQWEPEEAGELPDDLKQDTFWGTRILNVVLVHQPDLEPVPTSWHDLTEQDLGAPIAIPDPGFAGSAFGALGFFALDEDFGFDFYRGLADNGAVQVQAPGEVVTGVAEGRFAAGMSLDKVVRDAEEAGSPIVLAAPDPGAIAIYSPIAVVEDTESVEVAESFTNFTLTVEAQEAIASTGWQPVRDEVSWPHELPQVFPDWEAAFERREELLETYRSIMGG